MMKPESTEFTSVIQAYGHLADVRLGLSAAARHRSVVALNHLLAHSMALRDLYKKAHWQKSGPNFYQLHLLFDKHHMEQLALIDALAERVQTLGGVALALARDVAEESSLSQAPRGREEPTAQLQRLIEAHETMLVQSRPLGRQATDDGDDGTNDLITSQIVRTNELQSWFLSEQLAQSATTGRANNWLRRLS